jgi:hypothetical protein
MISEYIQDRYSEHYSFAFALIDHLLLSFLLRDAIKIERFDRRGRKVSTRRSFTRENVVCRDINQVKRSGTRK